MLSTDFLQNKLFQNILLGTLSECQTVWIQMGPKFTLFGQVISRQGKSPQACKELKVQIVFSQLEN